MTNSLVSRAKDGWLEKKICII